MYGIRPILGLKVLFWGNLRVVNGELLFVPGFYLQSVSFPFPLYALRSSPSGDLRTCRIKLHQRLVQLSKSLESQQGRCFARFHFKTFS